MKKKETRIVGAPAERIREMPRRRVRGNWAKSNAMNKVQVETAIASDPDEAGLVIDWASATVAPVPDYPASI